MEAEAAEALPYLDSLFKEYLLFRGFMGTLQAFVREIASDGMRAAGYQAERITSLVFSELLPAAKLVELQDLLDTLAARLYVHLDARAQAAVARVEGCVLRAALLAAARAGKQDKVSEFFSGPGGESLLSAPGGEGVGWRAWTSLAFVKDPRKDPAFAPYCSVEWRALVELSFRNMLSEVLASVPPPAVLRFNTDRRTRLALQAQVESLSSQLDSLKRQLALAHSQLASGGCSSSAGSKPPPPPPSPSSQPTTLQGPDTGSSGTGNGGTIPRIGSTGSTTGKPSSSSQSYSGTVASTVNASTQTSPPSSTASGGAVRNGSGRLAGSTGETHGSSPTGQAGPERPPAAWRPPPPSSSPSQSTLLKRPHSAAGVVSASSAATAAKPGIARMATASGIIAAAASTAAAAVSEPEQVPADAAGGSVKPSGTLEAHVKEQPQHHQHHHHQRNVSLNDWASMDATSLLSTIPSMPHKNDAGAPEQGASDNSSTAGIRNETLGSAAQTHGSQEGAAVGPISSVVGSSTASGSMGDEPDVVGQGGAVVSSDAPPAAKDFPLGSPPDLARALQQATAVGTSALGSAAHIRTRAPNHTPSTSADAIHTTPVIDVEEHSSDIGDDSDQGGLTDMDEQEASEAGADDHLRVSSPGIDRAGLCGMGDAGTVFENDGLEDKEAEHIEDAPSTSITHAEVAGVHPQPSTSTAHPVRLSSSPPIPILAGFNKHAAHATASAHGIRAEQAALSESLEEQLSPAAHAAASSLNAVTWAVAGAVAVPSPFASSAVGAAAHAGSAGGASQRLPSSWENASSLMAAAAGPGASVSTARHTLMHEGRVQCMRVSPGGGLYVCSCSDDGSAAIWPALSTAHTAAGDEGVEDPPLSLLPPISSSTSSASALPSAAASVASRVARLPCGGGCGVNALAWDVRADKVLLLGTRGRGIKAWHADTRRFSAELPCDVTAPWVTALATCPAEPVFVAACAQAHAHTGAVHQGRLGLWNMRAFKRTVLYRVPRDEAVVSLAFSTAAVTGVTTHTAGSGGLLGLALGLGLPGTSSGSGSGSGGPGTWFAAGTASGAVHLFDVSGRPGPLASVSACPTGHSRPAAVAVWESISSTGSSSSSAGVGSGNGSSSTNGNYSAGSGGVAGSSSSCSASGEPLIMSACISCIRVWSLRRMAEPMLDVDLHAAFQHAVKLQYVQHGAGATHIDGTCSTQRSSTARTTWPVAVQGGGDLLACSTSGGVLDSVPSLSLSGCGRVAAALFPGARHVILLDLYRLQAVAASNTGNSSGTDSTARLVTEGAVCFMDVTDAMAQAQAQAQAPDSNAQDASPSGAWAADVHAEDIPGTCIRLPTSLCWQPLRTTPLTAAGGISTNSSSSNSALRSVSQPGLLPALLSRGSSTATSSHSNGGGNAGTSASAAVVNAAGNGSGSGVGGVSSGGSVQSAVLLVGDHAGCVTALMLQRHA